MAGPYICIWSPVGTAHRTAILAYGTAHDLENVECSNGNYVCVGIGTGALAGAHRSFLTSYATAHELEHSEQATACT